MQQKRNVIFNKINLTMSAILLIILSIAYIRSMIKEDGFVKTGID